MYEAVKWGQKGARTNSIFPNIVVTTFAVDEFNGHRGDFYKNMFKNTGSFFTGSDFIIDGGATASYYYGPLKP